MNKYEFFMILCALGGVLAALVMIYNVLNSILVVLMYGRDSMDVEK